MALAPSSAINHPNTASVGHIVNRKQILASQSSRGFARLPAEINQEIAIYLSDKDLASFSRVQRQTCGAVLPTNAGHWRIRFKAQFDLPEGKAPDSIQADYKLRKHFLTKPIRFKTGQSSDEVQCLEAIKQLVVECFSNPTMGLSNNIQQLWRYMKKSNLLYDGGRWSSSVRSQDRRFPYGSINQMVIVQTVFFGWTLYFAKMENLSAAYPMSLRRIAYNIEWAQMTLMSRPKAKLILEKGEINVKILSALTRFWKFHLVINDDGSLYRIFSKLPEDEWPNAFQTKLHQGEIRLGRKWKGALFHPLTTDFERDQVHQHAITDGFYTGGDELLELNIQIAPQGIQWPDVFENEVHGLPCNPGEDFAFWLEPPKLLAVNKSTNNVRRPKFTEIQNSIHRSATGETAYNAELPWRQAQGSLQSPIFPVRSKGLPYEVFIGTGDANCGDRALCFAGVVHPLPPQAGIPGWQRFTMVSFETPINGTAGKGYLDAAQAELVIYMQYEGVILPGASMILGRYQLGKSYRAMHLADQMKHGPFIYWNVHDDIVDDNESNNAEDDEEVHDVNDDGGDADNAGNDAGGVHDGSRSEVQKGMSEEGSSNEANGSGENWTTEEEDEDEQYWIAALKALSYEDDCTTEEEDEDEKYWNAALKALNRDK